MKKEYDDYAERNGSDEPLGLISGLFILLGMILVSVLIADVASGFQLHELLADASSGA